MGGISSLYIYLERYRERARTQRRDAVFEMKSLIIPFAVLLVVASQSPPTSPPHFHGPNPNCRPLTSCTLNCPYRFRFGPDGCEICQCRSTPCFNETAVLPNVQCDGTPNGPKCPSTHDCIVQRANRTATPSTTVRGVCCIHIDQMRPRPSSPRPRRLF